MADMDERVELNYLLDFYGPLLTEHRQEVMRLYCEEDLTQQEIADQLSITRQGVFDSLAKSKRQLNGYEAKLGLVRGTGAKVLYANAYTIWNILAGINDGAGNKAFIPSPQADPVTKGVVYGYTVKEDNNLADKVIYAGAPSKILANNFEDLFINRAMDPKTFEDIVAGYSLFDAGLENPLAFVKVTFQ